MKETLHARLTEILERDLTKVEEAIIDWTIVQVEIEKLKESN
jgi:FtsZ-binding cell division protein ZapB